MPTGLAVAVSPALGGAAPSRQAAVTAWSVASLGASPPWSRMSRDGFSWDAGQSFVRDQYGKTIGVVVDNTGPQANWAWSNDGDLTYATSGAIDGGFLVRAALAYNSLDDAVYALWEGTNNTDGTFLRRYAITRDSVTHNITAISTTRDASLNLVLDSFTTSGSATYHNPQLLFLTDNPAWTHGALLAVWSVGQTGAAANGGEVRATFRALSNSAADNTATNWTAPAGAGTATITQGPTTGLGWSKLFGTSSVSTVIAVNGDPFGVVYRLASGPHAGDLCVAYYDAGGDAYRLARFGWRGASTYDFGGTVTRIDLAAHRAGVSDTDAGYNAKEELTSQISHNAGADRLYGGVSTWAGDGTNGDQWRLWELDLGTGVATTAVVYQATKANCQATSFVTGAAFYDPAAAAVVATYTDLPAKNGYSRTYLRTVPLAAAVSLDLTQPLDIPCLLPWRDANGKAVSLYRNFNAGAVVTPPTTPTYTAPYQGYVARGTWACRR